MGGKVREMKPARILATAMIVTVLWATCTSALDNGLAQTPPMGWNSWNAYELKINEELIRSAADFMVSSGMKDAGYQYVIVDAGWKSENRAANGRLVADAKKFPSGMKALADSIHAKGLKFGIYTDAGTGDCDSGAPGSKGYESQDAATFAAWGVDLVKVDWCNSEGLNAKEVYTRMSRAILATRRPMVLSVCEWGDNQPWLWAGEIAHMWRTTGDDKGCWDCGRETMNKPGGYPRGWTLILDAQSALQGYAGPGRWNDPDMLQVGNAGMNLEESRAQFSLWSILAAPLIAGNDLHTMPPEIAGILLNKEVIAVDQDPKGIQGNRVKKEGEREIWARPLRDGSQAVVLFNRGEYSSEITLQWRDLNWKDTKVATVRDLWAHQDWGAMRDAYTANVPSHGVKMIRVTPAHL
jgi:alpha-galactosidase